LVELGLKGEGLMKQSDLYRQNAENCMQMAEAAKGEPAYNRFKRMEATWLALAEEQDWLTTSVHRSAPIRGERELRCELLSPRWDILFH
jgi:hypothetical protein